MHWRFIILSQVFFAIRSDRAANPTELNPRLYERKLENVQRSFRKTCRRSWCGSSTCCPGPASPRSTFPGCCPPGGVSSPPGPSRPSTTSVATCPCLFWPIFVIMVCFLFTSQQDRWACGTPIWINSQVCGVS